MIDPGTGLTILGSAIGGAKILEKILGPSAEYIGDQIKEWTKKRISNTSNIFKNAEEKLGDKINEEGRVPPKVLKGILEDGAWCEEDLQVEYFGGVLASSRSGISRDDRGAYFTSLISRLSTYQLRTHYLFYQSIKKHFNGEPINIGDHKDRAKLQLFVPITTYVEAMDFSAEEIPNIWNLMIHSIWGLNKEELIDKFLYGGIDFVKTRYKEATQTGIIFQPTTLGVELLMWAFGYGQQDINHFFDSGIIFNNDQKIKIGETVITVKKEQTTDDK